MSKLEYQRAPKHAVAHALIAKGVVTDGTKTHRTRVVTLVEPTLRSKIDLAVESYVVPVHLDSLDAAQEEARKFDVAAMLISPAILERAGVQDLRRLLCGCPGIVTAAVVSESQPRFDNVLLDLGSIGIRTIIDLSDREGPGALRRIATQDGPVVAEILRTLMNAIQDTTPDARSFFAQLTRIAPTVTSVRALSAYFVTGASTIASRFHRAHLPPLKDYLVFVRLLYVSAYLRDQTASIASVSNRLRYSSPQALCRHVRLHLDVTGVVLRHELGFERLLQRVVDQYFVRFRQELRTFYPLRTITEPVCDSGAGWIE